MPCTHSDPSLSLGKALPCAPCVSFCLESLQIRLLQLGCAFPAPWCATVVKPCTLCACFARNVCPCIFPSSTLAMVGNLARCHWVISVLRPIRMRPTTMLIFNNEITLSQFWQSGVQITTAANVLRFIQICYREYVCPRWSCFTRCSCSLTPALIVGNEPADERIASSSGNPPSQRWHTPHVLRGA